MSRRTIGAEEWRQEVTVTVKQMKDGSTVRRRTNGRRDLEMEVWMRDSIRMGTDIELKAWKTEARILRNTKLHLGRTKHG